MSDSLQSLVDRAAFLSAEVQQRFGVLIAGSDFEVDFSAHPRVHFTGDSSIAFRPHMIGSSVDRGAEKTWHWGWDNVNDFPGTVVALSTRVRDYGADHGITQLTEAEFPVDAKDLPLAVTLAAKAITGAWAHYPVDAGGGTTVWVLIDDDRLALGEPELKPVVRAIASGITGVEVSDHRVALSAYAELRGLRTAMLPDGGVRVLCEDGSADVVFDDQERIVSCQAHQPLEGEAAEQFGAVRPAIGLAVFGQAFELVDETPIAPPVAADAPQPSAEPVVTSEVAPAAEPDAQQEATPSSEPEEAPQAPAEDSSEKKGFFKRLFGR